MKLLIDTHIFLWAFAKMPTSLPERFQLLISNRKNRLYLSEAAIWEMQIKQQLGRLKLYLPIKQIVELQVDLEAITLLPIALDHIWQLESLPLHHGDPFDRIMIAQTLVEDLQLVSVDERFPDYPIELIN